MLNKILLIGNLGTEPEVINKETEHVRCTFVMATSEPIKGDKNGEGVTYSPAWHNIVAFGHTAEYAGKNLHKGGQVLVEGKLLSKRWEDKSGIKHSSYEIIASAIFPLGAKQSYRDSRSERKSTERQAFAAF